MHVNYFICLSCVCEREGGVFAGSSMICTLLKIKYHTRKKLLGFFFPEISRKLESSLGYGLGCSCDQIPRSSKGFSEDAITYYHLSSYPDELSLFLQCCLLLIFTF